MIIDPILDMNYNRISRTHRLKMHSLLRTLDRQHGAFLEELPDRSKCYPTFTELDSLSSAIESCISQVE